MDLTDAARCGTCLLPDNAHRVEDCSHIEDVVIPRLLPGECFDDSVCGEFEARREGLCTSTDGDLRLVDGTVPNEERLEMLIGGGRGNNLRRLLE